MHPLRRFLLVTIALTVLAVLPTVSAEGDVESEMLGPGETFSHTFQQAGKTYYHCHPHPWMEGNIRIDPSDGSEPQTHVVKMVEPEGDSKGWGFEPAELTIRAGDTVQWVNEGQASHQIMAWVSEDPDAAPKGDGHAHEHGPVEGEESPAGIVFPLLGALALVALARRR